MHTLRGYRLNTVISQGARSVVYKGVRIHDNVAIIAKFHTEEHPESAVLQRIRREFEIGRTVDHPCVAPYLALEKNGKGLTVVTRDTGGEVLSEYLKDRQMNVSQFLQMAVAISEGLAAVHHAGIMHKDLNPSNITINRETGQVQIIDFGLSSQLDQERNDSLAPNRLGGTLAYISPEQTGRTNHAVDYRTDFYSLGATFYQMLLGRTPFSEVSDALGLIHAHIARLPASPLQSGKKIPAVLSDLIMKMLAKDPAERYQSARGLLADLKKCREKWVETGTMERFELGSADRVERFRLPVKLYGRQSETDYLLRAFSRVGQGRSELVMIAGAPGVGKSSLVHELQKPLAAQRGFFCSGKFEQYLHNAPFSAVGHALDQLCRLLLTMDDEKLDLWKKRLNKKVGAGAGQLTRIVPMLAHVLGLEETGEDNEDVNRQGLQLVMVDFIQTFARCDRPFVIFLDDLQWADAASLDLLHMLGETRYCLIIGAYRDNEVDATHLLHGALEKLGAGQGSSSFSQITLCSLTRPDLELWLADALQADPVEISLLADLMMNKTDGNPFFFAEFLKRLYDESLIFFHEETGGWRWDLEAIVEMGITDNVVSLMQDKIRIQPVATRKLLETASCVGTRFDAGLLGYLTEMGEEKVIAGLWPAVREGLIITSEERKILKSEKDKLVMRFPHDRVRQAAYDLMDEDEKDVQHLHIGRRLFRSRVKEQFFMAVEHLNKGRHLLTDPEERISLSRLNLEAGRKARNASAADAAANHFQTGLDLLPPDSWQSHGKLTRDLHGDLAECCFRLSQWEESERLHQELLAHSRSPLEKVVIHKARVDAFEYAFMTEEIYGAAADGLATCQITLPMTEEELDREIALEIEAMDRARGEKTLLEILPREPVTDPVISNAIIILNQVTIFSFKAGKMKYMEWSALKGLNLIREFGMSEEALGLLIRLATSYWTVGDHARAFHFGDQVLPLLKEWGGPEPNVMGDFYSLFQCFRIPLPKIIAFYKRTAELQWERNDYFALTFNYGNRVFFYFAGGVQLGVCFQQALKALEICKRSDIKAVADYAQAILENVTALMGGVPEGMLYQPVPGYLEKEAELPFMGPVLQYHRLEQALWLNGAEAAWEAADFEFGDVCQGLMLRFVGEFLRAMVFAAADGTATPSKRRKIRKVLRAVLTDMERLSGYCLENFEHKMLLLQAEMSRLGRKSARATCRLYEQAVASAADAGFIQYEALAHERLACFWRDEGMLRYAGVHLREAHYLYGRWGARAVADALVDRYREINVNIALLARERKRWEQGQETATYEMSVQTDSTTRDAVYSPLDLQAIMKAVRAISGEIQFDRLLTRMLHTMMESAGARRIMLVMDRESGLRVEAMVQVDGDATLCDRALDEETAIPQSLIRFVFRSGAPVLLPDPEKSHLFLEDVYLKEYVGHAHLCVPLRQKDRVSGVLYLENDLSDRAFTEQRITVLKVLLTQAGVSMENARLYSQIQTFNENLEAMVEERTQQLADTQKELVEKAHLAGMADVAISVLHNLGNLLNSVTVSSQIIDGTVRSSRFGNVLKANKVLATLMEEWGQTEHPKAQKLLKYYQFVQEMTAEEHNAIRDQTQVILEKVNLIQDVVQAQEQYTSGGSLVEPFSVRDAVEDASGILQGMLLRNEVDLNIDLDCVMVKSQKAKLSYVLINILRNAVEASAGLESEKRKIRVAAAKTPTDVLLQIMDKGRGIPNDHLNKIFNHGFSTKGSGRGFGLHNCANAVTELGGAIWAESQGPGMGAIFSIRLPLADSGEAKR